MQFVTGWSRWLMILVVLIGSRIGGAAEPVADADAKSRWIERLSENAELLLADDTLPASKHSYVVFMTCVTWGLVDRAEQAVELADKHLSGHERDVALTMVVASQSDVDDVPGALGTIERIEHPLYKQRAWTQLVSRQARRGDIADALELLRRIDDDRGQDRAREWIIHQYLKDGDLEKAEEMAEDVGDVVVMDNVEQKLERFRTRPQLDDDDYVPRTVAQAKKDRELFGISDDQVEFLWHTARAEVAIHEEDAATFRHAIGDAKHYAQKWSGVQRRNALIQIASLYARQGDKQAAQQAYRAILALFLEKPEASAIDLGRLSLSVNRFFPEVASHLTDEELEQWIVILASMPDSGDLIGGIVAAKYNAGASDWCEQMVKHCATPRQRFEVSVRVLLTYGLSE